MYEYVFNYYNDKNCILLSKLFWPSVSASHFKSFFLITWIGFFMQWTYRIFLTCSSKYLRSNTIERLGLKLEKMIGILGKSRIQYLIWIDFFLFLKLTNKIKIKIMERNFSVKYNVPKRPFKVINLDGCQIV